MIMMKKKSTTHSGIRKTVLLAAILLLALLLSGCRTRISNRTDIDYSVPDEDGTLKEDYDMRREDLGLEQAKQSIFHGLSLGGGDYEDYDEEYYDDDEDFEWSEEDYGEEDYDEPEDTENPSTTRPSTTTGTTSRPGTTIRRPTTTIRPNTTNNTTSTLVTVTFDPNGGETSSKSKKVRTGYSYGTLPTPTREGYSFSGWYTEKSKGTKVTSTTKMSAKKDHTLYAHWEKNNDPTYVVTFDANEGDLDSADATRKMQEGDKYGSLPVPAREGYVFDGWYTKKSGGSKVSKGDTFDGTENITLYAHWTEEEPEENPYDTWVAEFNGGVESVDEWFYYFVDTEDDESREAAGDYFIVCNGKEAGDDEDYGVVVTVLDSNKISKYEEKANEIHEMEEYSDKDIIIISSDCATAEENSNKELLYLLGVLNSRGADFDLKKAAKDLGSEATIYYKSADSWE